MGELEGNKGAKPRGGGREARPCRRPLKRRHVSAAKALLLEKYGNLSNREIAARIGVVERDAPTMLSMALSGRGSRRVRCAIAVALGDLPSRLWPDRPPKFMADDDAQFNELTRQDATACCASQCQNGGTDKHWRGSL
ncbi:hypothetical protein C7C56_024785 [Massilia glaciei]|uniref:Ner winged helix-turn-helix DNA-binding domain-containing protein n=2 Tax=Massilia glaciei TaxID=1524097 RepID=A0A2U2HDR9_9BURK|nr:hypothetical protein C7C56_024785 [Massilia glaciei]